MVGQVEELEMAVVMGQGNRRERNIHYKVRAKLNAECHP